MRSTREQTAQTRERIVNTAARVFRDKGINGIGVADLMGEAGLTHGGFYKHFASKDALVAEACDLALESTHAELSRAAEQAEDAKALEALVRAYLSKAHCDHPEQGCAIAALGPEAIRGNEAVKGALTQGTERLTTLVQHQLQRSGVAGAETKAHAVLASMIGGLVLARCATSPAQAKQVLKDTQDFILQSVQRPA